MKQTLPFLALVLLSSACHHVTTKVPGVLDLRSDGSEAAVAKDAPKTSEETARTGFGAIMNGDGVTGTSNVSIVDRKYWIIGLIPIMNESATEEIQAAMGDGAMRNVKVGDSFTVTDIGISIAGGFLSWVPVVGLVNLILPPFDVTVSGTRIETAAGGTPVEPPPPTEGAPPTDSTAPSTTPGT